MADLPLAVRLRARANHFATRDGGPDTTERLLRAAADEIERITSRLADAERAVTVVNDLDAASVEHLRDVAVQRLAIIADRNATIADLKKQIGERDEQIGAMAVRVASIRRSGRAVWLALLAAHKHLVNLADCRAVDEQPPVDRRVVGEIETVIGAERRVMEKA